MTNLVSVRMPDGTVIQNVPENITQQELMTRYEAYKSQPTRPTGQETRTTAGTTPQDQLFPRLQPDLMKDVPTQTRAQQMGLGPDDFTWQNNLLGAGELVTHLATFMPSEAANSVGGAIASGVAFMDGDPKTTPMDAYMIGRELTGEKLEDVDMAFGLQGLGKYEPRTKEGQYFVDRFNHYMSKLAVGQEAEDFVRDRNLPDEVALGAKVVGDGWLLALGLKSVSGKGGKGKSKNEELADGILRDAEIEASRVRFTPYEPPPAPFTSRLGTPSIDSSAAIIGGSRLSSEFAGVLTAAAKDQLQGKKSGDRVFMEIAALIDEGYYGLDAVFNHVKKRYSLTDAELANIFRNTGTESGRFLNKLSQIKKEMERLAKENPAMADLLKAFEKSKVPHTTGDTILNTFRKLENTRRTGLTSQLITAVRNAQAATAMSMINMVERAVAVPMRGVSNAIKDRSFRPIYDEFAGLFEMTKAIGRMTPKGRQKLQEIMAEHPLQNSVLFSKRNPLTAEVYGDLYMPRFMQILQTFNRTQEHFFLRTAMEMSLRDQLGRAGKNFNTINPKDIPQRMIEQAFQTATEVVFASRPKGTAVKRAVRAWNEWPILSMSVTPFPRFMFANYIPFAGEFGPHSLIRFLSPKARERFLKDPEYASRITARAVAGTAAFSLFLHNAMHKDPAAKPTEVQVGDKFYDMTPFAPITAPMMILAEAIVAPENIQNKDLLSAITGVNRNGPTLIGASLDLKADNLGEILMRMGGEYVGSYFVPMSQLKDLSAGFSPDEAVIRSAKGHPFFGPILKNVPFGKGNPLYSLFNEFAPPAYNPLYPGAKRHTNPWRNQLTGSRPKTKTMLEKEAERLDIAYSALTPQTGDRKWDNMVNYYWGHFNDQIMMPALLNTPEYRDGSPAVKRKMFKTMLQQTKPYAIARFAANHPREGGKLLAQMAQTSKDDFAIISEMYGKTPEEFEKELGELYQGVLSGGK